MSDNTYKDLLNYYREEEINNLFRSYYHRCEIFLHSLVSKRGIEKRGLYIHDTLFDNFMLSFLSDLPRIRNFHGIENLNASKLTAYSCFWFARWQPLQITNNSNDYNCPNIMFALSLIRDDCCLQCDGLSDSHKKEIKGFFKELHRYFMYRRYDPQIIELSLDSFKHGESITRT